MQKLYQYNDYDFRLVCTKSDKKPKKSKVVQFDDYIPQTDELEIQRISLSRSKRMIREYALSNDFRYFFTSTVNSEFADRFSLTECQRKIKEITKAIKRKNKDFIYLFITERHKDGAFHFHGLCSNLDLYINKYGYFSSKDFDKLGFNSFSVIFDKSKCSNYITKYITKECIKNEKGSVYFCSKGLKRAVSYEIAPIDFYPFKKKIFENDFVYVLDLNLKELNTEQLLYFRDNIIEKETFFDILLGKLKRGELLKLLPV